MRILQVIPALGFGGAETMCINLSIELKRMGCEVLVVSLYEYLSPLVKKLDEYGIHVIYLSKKKGIDLSLIKKLRKLIQEFKPDVLHSHLYSCKYAHIAASLEGVKKKIHTIHNMAQYEASNTDRMINKGLFKLLHVIPVSLSKDIQKTVMTVYNLKNEKIPIIYNGIPLERCQPVNEYLKNAYKLIHVGRFAPAKNHFTLIRAVARVHERFPSVELSLYGEGELFKDSVSLVKQLNAESFIYFCGTTDDIYKVLSKSGIFVLPSIWEGMPMTLIEAMGTALPLIATNVGGIPDMLENNTNAILINSDENQLVDAICQLLEDGQLRKKLGINAKIKSNIFSATAMAKGYIELYNTETKL